MRALTTEEKKLSSEARKRANQAISQQRRELGRQIRACTAPAQTQRKMNLLRQFDSLSDIKGQPVLLTNKDRCMVIDYELFRRLARSLKHRRVDLRIEPGGLLTIHHEDPWNSRNHGEIELHELPGYQQMLLTDLPWIELNTD